MSVANIAIVLIVILACVVAFISKRSIDRHNINSASISKVSLELSSELNALADDITSKMEETKASLASIHCNISEEANRAKTAESALSQKVNALKDTSSAAVNEAKKQAASGAENAFMRAAQYADYKANAAINHADELHGKLISQLEERISNLTSIIEALNAENAQLWDELNEQRRKLNFYANIEEDAESLTVKDDIEKRARDLESIRNKVFSAEETQSPAPKAATTSTSALNQSDGEGDTEDASLDNEQEFARDYMDSTAENVFVTGKAGTGKSFLLDAFRLTTLKSNIVLAPTGIAALNVRGATLHSTFGYYNLVNLQVDEINVNTIRLKSEKREVLKRINTIIIDEISMVRADVFDKIDRILKTINRTELPFGGKQMIVFGDLFQLPPISRGQETDYLFDRYGGIFFFHSDAYKAGNFKFIELTENHRQKGDDVFFAILNRVRVGEVSDTDIEMLNTRYTPSESVYDRYTSLFPTKAEAELVNRSHMNQIESMEYIFNARILLDKKPNKNKNLENIFPISEELRLRLGANVMMVANDPEGRWVNGTVGIVKELSQDRIVVSFGKRRNYEIYQFEFDEQEISYIDGKITYEKVFSVMQYPIVPAYAITIHKSQGQTYDNVMCDIERCFASGQAYVALSRCASLEGLHLRSLVTPASIKVDHEVVDFYHTQLANNLLN